MANTYESWRRTIPFTNEQIIAVFEEYLDNLEKSAGKRSASMVAWYRNEVNWLKKTGRLKAKVVAFVLPLMVKVCAVCGKKALYRYGTEGRCSKHRDVRPGFIIAAQKDREVRASVYEQSLNDEDQDLRYVAKLATMKKESQRKRLSRG